LKTKLITKCLYRSECGAFGTNDYTSGGRCDWLHTNCLVDHPWFPQTSARFVYKI